MKSSKLLLATSFVAVLACVPSPAFAQRHGGGSRGGSADRGGAGSRDQSRGVSPRSAPRSQGGFSRGGGMGPRARFAVRGGYYGAGRFGISRYSRVAPGRFYRPYYTFRPRLSLGFGLWAGYPFAYDDPFYYPYGYVNPYAYAPYNDLATRYPAYPPASGYQPQSNDPRSVYPPQSNDPRSGYPLDQEDPQGSIGVEPDQEDTGGLSFNITPNNAQLLVDGTLVGTAGQFTPTTQPLGLVAGRHQIEVRAPGYQTMSFAVDIIAGQVIPYQGTLDRR